MVIMLHWLKLAKIPLLGSYLGKDRVSSMGHTQNQVQFFVGIINVDHKLPRTVYFIKI